MACPWSSKSIVPYRLSPVATAWPAAAAGDEVVVPVGDATSDDVGAGARPAEAGAGSAPQPATTRPVPITSAAAACRLRCAGIAAPMARRTGRAHPDRSGDLEGAFRHAHLEVVDDRGRR